MVAPNFTGPQRIALATYGLGHAQIDELEKTLPFAKKWMDAEVPPMQDVRDVLSESRQAMQAAMTAAERLIAPTTAAQREAANRVIVADENDDPALDGTAINNAFLALTTARDVLDQALAELPKEERRKRTSTYLFRRIDKALLDGFIKDVGIGIKGLPSKPYIRIEPFNGGIYLKIIRIIYDAMGRWDDNPDKAIRNYITSLKSKKNTSA